MTSFNLAGRAIEFADCHEVGQGGPETCTMSVDGEPVARRLLWGPPRALRFHPSPLEFDGALLVPLWKATRFYLVRIDPRTLKLKRLTGGYGYMRLLHMQGAEVEFSTSWDDTETHRLELPR